MLDKLEEILTLNTKTIPEKPLSVFLSGGIDSSLVLALLRKTYPNIPIRTFSLALSDSYPDIIFSREMAERFQTEHTELILSENEYRDYLQEYEKIRKHNFKGDANIYILCSEAKKFSKDIVTGDGGDECFGGYWLHKYPLGHKENGHVKSFEEIHPSPKKHIEEMVQLGFRDFYYKEKSSESDYNTVWDYFMEIMAPRHLSPLFHIADELDVNVYTPLFSDTLIQFLKSLPFQECVDRKIERMLSQKYLPQAVIERESIGFDLALDKEAVAN